MSSTTSTTYELLKGLEHAIKLMLVWGLMVLLGFGLATILALLTEYTCTQCIY